jgi:NitT/TauT family transport system ATP-binding protein
MLYIDNLSFKYKDCLTTLHNIFLECKTHETISIIGRSGVGKTTLLNLICGNQNGYSGNIVINGMNPSLAAKNCAIGYVFQSPTLIPWLTVYENIALPLKFQSSLKTREEINNAILDVMYLAKIDHAAKFFPSQLSGGMQTRAALARALVYSPSLLLLDEPFNTLDDIIKEEIYTDLQFYLSQVNVASVIITHNLSEAIRLSDRIYVLSHNKSENISEIVHCEDIMFEKPRNMDIAKLKDFYFIQEKLMRILQ